MKYPPIPSTRSMPLSCQDGDRVGRSCRHHGHDRVADLDLVACLQQLGRKDAPPVERGAVGGVEVFDVPQATNGQETGVLAGSEVVVDNKGAFTADGEVTIEGTTLVSDLNDQGLA